MAVLGGPGRGGAGLAVVGDLAVQELAACPQAHPSSPGAVHHGIGGQLVRGRGDVVDPLPAQPGLGGVRGDRRPQRVQRADVEFLLQGSEARGRGALVTRPGCLAGSRSPVIDGHQLDAGDAGEAEPREPGSDLGQAPEGHPAGGGDGAGGVGDHQRAAGVDERERGQVDRDVPVKADRLGQRQRQRLAGLEVQLARDPDAGRGVLAADPQQRTGVVGGRGHRAGCGTRQPTPA